MVNFSVRLTISATQSLYRESLHRSAVSDSSSKFWTDRVDRAFLLSLPI